MTAIGTDFVVIAGSPETKKEFDGISRFQNISKNHIRRYFQSV